MEKPLPSHTGTPPAGEAEVAWHSPSNIALVKYWGKRGGQLPMNPSVSFTLDACHTETRLLTKNPRQPIRVFVDGEEAPGFLPKVEQFFKRSRPHLSMLDDYSFDIHTRNTFPHGSGIASSASGLSALALCLIELERRRQPDMDDATFYKKASFLSRLGSGSACRSVYGGLVVWGAHPDIEGSNDLHGIPYPKKVHPVFKSYRDTILLVDTGEKQVSSTAGHDLMKDHPFAVSRFEQAKNNLSRLVPVLEEGDLDDFIHIVENEALSLHAMMMTSDPAYVLMKPATLEIIRRIWAYRKDSGSKLCFTLDAGANVHLLYPEAKKEQALAFIKDELAGYCKDGRFVEDRVGEGARAID